MSDPIDNRFSHITSDPRFRTLRKSDKRVKVDKRFRKMFTEKKFKLKYSVDKRGKRKNEKEEDLEKFYDLSDSDAETQEKQKTEGLVDQESDLNIESKVLEPIKKPNIPNARGVDTDEESDLSSSSESEDSDGETEELIHEWNEWDKGVAKTETATKRLAICNLDWDRINARDLFVLVNSFKPSDGSILSVKIYPSEFGLERMKIEAESGPIPFLKGANKDNVDNDCDADVDDPKLREELRQYELTRLKYFYAVVECDTPLTAEALYNELDGMEYESSSTALDLRFIDDDITFDGQTKSECYSMPDMSSYKAPQFINTALQQSKVEMTWDQTDPKRKDVFERAFHKEEEGDDLKAYLATSSEEEDFENDVDLNDDNQLSTEDRISKYKKLLNSLDEPNEDNKDNEGNMEMEISWQPNLKDVAEDIVSRKRSEKDISAFEHDHLKLKDKRKQSKKQINELNSEEEAEERVEEVAPKKNKNKRKNKDKNQEKDPNLELLVMDDNEEGDKKHFNYKNIVEKKINSSDSFKFNADDPRFAAVYTSHHYNVDPSDPHYKRTEAFDQIMTRTTKKIKHNELEDTDRDNNNSTESSKSWTHLVRTVKNKSQMIHNKRPKFNVKQTKFKN